VQNIFAPIAWPVNRVGGWVHDKVAGGRARDDGSPGTPRTPDELIRENMNLRVEIGNLQGQRDRLQEREAERAKLGQVGDMCTPFSVVGADSGTRESLMINASSSDGLRENMPVLYTRGIVGVIARVGAGGAQVLLITDRLAKPMSATFARFARNADGMVDFQRLQHDPVLVEGAGGGKMSSRVRQDVVENIGLKTNDWVVLSDRDWPLLHSVWPALDGYRIGYVASIVPDHKPGFMMVQIRPDENLMGLREVMVMNKRKG
jgi:cell shape-determining protein MreC